MAIKTGFGTKKMTMVHSGDRNVIIQLRGSGADTRHRIRSIFYSYGILASVPDADFLQGRLAVLLGLYDNITEEIAANSILAPDSPVAFSEFTSIFDHNLADRSGMINFGEAGLLGPKGVDLTVVLFAPYTKAETQPDFASMIGALTVTGVTEGLGDPYPKTR